MMSDEVLRQKQKQMHKQQKQNKQKTGELALPFLLNSSL